MVKNFLERVETTQMKALDLCSGYGGWSDGLVMEGFEVLGVEINPEIASFYKHPVLVEDIRNLKGTQFPNYDLIVGSPPCRDFTQIPDKHWKRKKNIGDGLSIVNAFLRIVEEAQPKFWLMENVKRLTECLYLKPVCRARLGKGMYRYFWGKFPRFLVPLDMTKEIWHVGGKFRSWERAKIPLPIARAFGKAVKEALREVR